MQPNIRDRLVDRLALRANFMRRSVLSNAYMYVTINR